MAGRATTEQLRVAAALRARQASWVRIAETIRHDYDGVSALEALRIAHGWRQRDVADAWNRRWPDELIDPQKVSYAESWLSLPGAGREPRLSTLMRFAEIMECDVEDLVRGLATFGHLDPYSELMNRREFVAAAAAAAALPSLPVAAFAVPMRVGADDVERLRQATWALWEADQRIGGAPVYDQALALARQVHRLLDTASYGPTVGRDLQRVHGEAQTMSGWCAFDAGRQRLARQHFESALLAASLGEDPGLAARVLHEMSLQASQYGSPREGVELAQFAQRTARPVATDLLLSVLADREGLGHAHRGDTWSSREAFGRSERLFTDYRPGHDAPWLGYTVNGLGFAPAKASLLLGQPLAAEQAFRVAVTRCTNGFDRTRVRNTAHLAVALGQQGRIDECASVAADAVGLKAGVASWRVDETLRSIEPVLAAHPAAPGVPEALDLLHAL
jgi:hypothetical protein